MPWFRIRRRLPARLDYPGASYALECVRQRHEALPMDEWVFRARKIQPESFCVLASAVPWRSRLEQLLTDGFEVKRGTPAEKIMERLVREGFAEDLPREPQ